MIEHHEMKHLFKQVMDEVSGYREYKECSEKHAESAPTIAEMYGRMADQELKHAEMLIEIIKIGIEDNPETDKLAYDLVIDYAQCAVKEATK